MKSIEEFNPKIINHKYNLFEKNNFLTNLFLQIIKSSGWTNVLYSDKDVVVVFNEETKSLICVLVSKMTYTEFSKIQLSQDFGMFGPTVFASSKDIEQIGVWNTIVDEETFLTTEIFFHIQLREITKNLKIPQMWEVYNHILISVFKKIDYMKTEKKEYENNLKSFFELKTTIITIETELKKELNYIINKTHNYE
jgi:hypothetical protein